MAGVKRAEMYGEGGEEEGEKNAYENGEGEGYVDGHRTVTNSPIEFRSSLD